MAITMHGVLRKGEINMKKTILKKMAYVALFLALCLTPLISMATDVGGIISSDTIWDLAGSPYTITSEVQVGAGATLTVEPGVIINDGAISVWGILKIIGTDSQRIHLNNIYIKAEEDNNIPTSQIIIKFANILSGSPYWGEGHGTLTLTDSYISNTNEMIYLWYPYSDCFIERNIFNNSEGISVGHYGPSVYIRNNVFYEQTGGYAVENWANYSGQTVVEYNSFLSTDRIVLLLPSGYDPTGMVAINNYWGTIDVNEIESMIYDKNDDLGCGGYIEFSPILTEPHPDTPLFIMNQPPTANAGPDQIVFDEITLDGTQSSDTDGTIVSYDWQIQNQDDLSTITTTGVTPTITGLKLGFYDVTLTVTDDEDAIGIDSMFFSATGPVEECAEATFSTLTGKLHIPTVIVDGQTPYDVTMQKGTGANFSLINATPK